MANTALMLWANGALARGALEGREVDAVGVFPVDERRGLPVVITRVAIEGTEVVIRGHAMDDAGRRKLLAGAKAGG